ncbi:MAG: hypothetical protein R2809_10060 [Flavobacteriales bacterium]
MTNNWDDIEDLLKKKLSSGAGPMMDSEQMWANVSQSLPNRKRKWWIFGLTLLILVGGAFGFVGYFGKNGSIGNDGIVGNLGENRECVGVREYGSLRNDVSQTANGRDTLQCVSGEGMDNVGNFGEIGSIGATGNDGNIGLIGKDGFVGNIGKDGKSVEVREFESLKTENNQSFNGRDTLQCVSGEEWITWKFWS